MPHRPLPNLGDLSAAIARIKREALMTDAVVDAEVFAADDGEPFVALSWTIGAEITDMHVTYCHRRRRWVLMRMDDAIVRIVGATAAHVVQAAWDLMFPVFASSSAMPVRLHA